MQGTQLGPYRILDQIGAGGMGEVWRGEDPRLGRQVAIKVLPDAAALDEERRARFEQEARAASALNHPSIVTIFDIGEADGRVYLAMEMVEGQSLRALLENGPLPPRKAVDIAAQVADGLAKAHEAGIVHRDLKPDNVMVSRDGFAKILDFGLAKLVAVPEADVSHLATVRQPSTQPGMVMGTVGYMSPEQAAGREVDYHSDQFSLGCVLYEMLTGKRPFERETTAETMAAIIRDEPESIAALNPRCPAPLRWLVDRCLTKDPEERFASTRDLARDLAAIREHYSETLTSGQIAAAAAPRRRVPGAAWAALGLVVGAGVSAWLLSGADTTGGDVRFQRLTYRRGTVMSARFAPDGQTVVYTAAWDSEPARVYTVRLDGPASRELGLPPADVLAVSAGGDLAVKLDASFSYGWERPGTLAQVSLGGGAPRPLLEDVESADFAPDGRLVVARDVGAFRRLEFPVGTQLYETTGWISNVRMSKDGARVAFFEHGQRGDNSARLMVVEPGGEAAAVLVTNRSGQVIPLPVSNGLAWSPDGEELWSGGGAGADLQGNFRRWFFSPTLIYMHDTAVDGRALVSTVEQRREIVGSLRGEPGETNLSYLDWSLPEALSDDGELVLFDEQNQGVGFGNYDVYLHRRGEPVPVLLGQGEGTALSPDGRWALLREHTESSTGLALLPIGPGERRPVPTGDLRILDAEFFPDGEQLLALAVRGDEASRLWRLSIAGGEPQPVTPEGVQVYRWRALSPDGTRAVAMSPEQQLTLYPLDGGEPLTVPGVSPTDVPCGWAADGRLFVLGRAAVPARVDLLDVDTGERTTWREITPPDPAGIQTIGPVRVSTDGESYIYSYRRVIHTLGMISGVR